VVWGRRPFLLAFRARGVPNSRDFARLRKRTFWTSSLPIHQHPASEAKFLQKRILALEAKSPPTGRRFHRRNFRNASDLLESLFWGTAKAVCEATGRSEPGMDRCGDGPAWIGRRTPYAMVNGVRRLPKRAVSEAQNCRDRVAPILHLRWLRRALWGKSGGSGGRWRLIAGRRFGGVRRRKTFMQPLESSR
jgi:hypothetical protein